MDEFLKAPEECIAQAREMKPEEGFLGKDLGETASNGLQILEEKKQKIWKIIAISLQGADFLQIINPSLYDTGNYKCGEGEINWKNVGLSPKFFELATSKIELTLPYLEEFTPEKVKTIKEDLAKIAFKFLPHLLF